MRASTQRSLILFFIICLMWQGGMTYYDIPNYVAPTPLDIVRTLYDQRHHIAFHGAISGMEVIMGLILGLIMAGGSAIFFDYSPRMLRIIMPYLIIFKNLPIFVLAPLMMMGFGHGIMLKGVLIGLSCYFPMTLGLIDGLKHSRHHAFDLMQSLSQIAPPPYIRTLWSIRLPLALPIFFTSARLAFLHAPMSVIACDWIGASSGLGYIMMLAYGQLDLAMLFSSLCVLLIMSLMFYHAVQGMERIVFRALSLHPKENFG